MVYVAYLPQIYILYNKANRFVLWWTGVDSLALLLAMLAWAVILWAVLQTGVRWLRRRASGSWLSRMPAVIAAALAVAVIIRTVASILVQSLPEFWIGRMLSVRTIRLGVYAVPAAVLSLLCREQTLKALRSILIIIVPAWLLLALQIPFWSLPTGADGDLKQVLAGRGDDGGDLFIFLFDAWSYERTFSPDGAVDLTSMPNLQTFIKGSTLYSGAYSPAIATMHSMPRFLYQRGADEIPHSLMVAQGGRYWSNKSTIFDVLDPERGKPRIAVGFGLDYREMLAHHVDYAESVASCHGDRITAGVAGKTKESFLTQLAWLKSLPGIGSAAEGWLFSPIVKEYAYEVVQRTFETVADSNVRGGIGFFHYPLPHRPFVWRDGRRMPTFPKDAHSHKVKNYMDNLAGVDHVLGAIVKKLKDTGRYDASTIVMLADHSWKQDPGDGVEGDRDEAVIQDFDADPKHRWKHVPLIIKWPHQTTGAFVTNDIFTAELGNFIRDKLKENRNDTGVY